MRHLNKYLYKKIKNLNHFAPPYKLIQNKEKPEQMQIDKMSKTGVNHYCINPQCPHQLRRRIEYFVSNERNGGMDISGFGEKIVERLCSLGFLKDIADIYTLKEHKNKLINIDGMGMKAVAKLLDAIEKSKEQPFHRVLCALGIRYVGEKNAKILAQHFLNIDNLIAADLQTLININDIGVTIAKSVFDNLHNDDFIALINRLRAVGLKFEAENITAESNKLSGKSFVFTGELSSMTRTEAAKLVEQFGGKESKSVSKKTSFVVVGESPGSKYNKALELGITILNEEEFKELLEE